MSQHPSHLADEENNGLDVLAELIAMAYLGAEDRLTRYLGPIDKRPKDWIYEYLNRAEQEQGTDGILNFIGDLSRLDQIIRNLGADVDEIGNDRRKHEVLRRLRIAEHSAPNGVLVYLDKIESMRLSCGKTNDYHKLLGQGMDACIAIEDLLNSLILFYGGFCQAVVFSAYLYWRRRGYWHTHSKRTEHPLLDLLCNYINDSKLRGSVKSFLERDRSAQLWHMTELLLHLDMYAKNYPRFAYCFGRESIFSSEGPDIATVRSARRRPLTVGRRDILGLLNNIRDLRNDLPHRKGDEPAAKELQTTNGLRQHLYKLFDAIERFKRKGESLSLFPSTGLLIQKSDRINRGPRIELYSESKERVVLPCSDLRSIVVGAEYFYWSTSQQRNHILVLKELP